MQATKRPAKLAKSAVNVQPGRRYVLLYPQHPYYGIPSSLVPHFVRVDRVLNVEYDQFELDEIKANPLLFRSQFRILATDVATGAKVEFFHKWVIDPHEVTVDPSITVGCGGDAWED